MISKKVLVILNLKLVTMEKNWKFKGSFALKGEQQGHNFKFILNFLELMMMRKKGLNWV